MKNKLTQAEAFKLFDYDKLTGKLYWKIQIAYRVKVGDEVGNYNPTTNMIETSIYNIRYGVHQIIFLLECGYIPNLIDYKDRNSCNNIFSNLREANKSTNACNSKIRIDNTIGVKGISYNIRDNAFITSITKDGKHIKKVLQLINIYQNNMLSKMPRYT
jgi:hypothetical protein